MRESVGMNHAVTLITLVERTFLGLMMGPQKKGMAFFVMKENRSSLQRRPRLTRKMRAVSD